jgi:hypothetical protein
MNTDLQIRVGGLIGLVLLERASLMKVALALDLTTPKPWARNPTTTPKCDQAIVGENITTYRAKNDRLKWAVDKELTIVRLGYGDDVITIAIKECNVLLQVGALIAASIRCCTTEKGAHKSAIKLFVKLKI